ncbi:MAG: hypothetical protein KBT40_02280, partial [bacterium]|nr:hypothetical protein [Candidatus Minthenecus merdequi]
VSSAGYTITSDDVQFVVTQPANGEFTVAFLPQNNTDIAGHTITIHDNAFGSTTTNDYEISVEGYTDTLEIMNFGNTNARSTSTTKKQMILAGMDKVSGLMLSSDEMNTYMIDNQSVAFAATDGQHTVTFAPFHHGQYNNKMVYLCLNGANNTVIKYPLMICNGTGNQVDLSSDINWVNTTIATLEQTTGMAVVNNATYGSYVRLYYKVNDGIFYDYASNDTTGLSIDSTEIMAPYVGVSNVTAYVEALDGSGDFIGQSSSDITATDKKIQKISYSNNIHYVVLNDSVLVYVYSYDSKVTSTHIDANFTMTSADNKVEITKGTYDSATFVQQFTIKGVTSGTTTIAITSSPNDTESEYDTVTVTGIPVTILADGNNCIVSVLADPSDNQYNTSASGGTKTFALTGAPCRKFTATLNYGFGTPTLNISDGTNTLVNTTYSTSILAWETKTENITYTYNAALKYKPTLLTVKLTGTGGFIGIEEGAKDLIITEYTQLSYFDVISNHPNNSTIDFGDVTIGTSSVNETIQVDYSALHKAVALTLSDESNFTIVNKSEVLGAITSCSQWDTLDIIIKYNPTTAEPHNATLTIKGYTTDDTNSESIKEYNYNLTGTGKKRQQYITWNNDSIYFITDLDPTRTLTLDAESNQPEYGRTTKMPITYTLDDDGDGVATLSNGVLTVAKAGTITVTAHQAGDEYTEAATDKPLVIRIDATLHFIGSIDDDWYNAGNWSPRQIVPTTVHCVSIDSTCVVRQNTDAATCLDLVFAGIGAVTVDADGVLDIAGKVTNNDATRLTLKANIDNNATVLFAEGNPLATVESYIKGTPQPQTEPEAKSNPEWQYRGFIGTNPVLNAWNVVIFKWNENLNSTNCWNNSPVYEKTGSYTGTPWDGYCMANFDTENAIYRYTTKLIPTDTGHTYNLTYTDNGDFPNRGVSLITNSWSAPIDMSNSNGVRFNGNVEHTFYFYKTRTHLSWETDKTGTFVVYPQATGQLIYEETTSNQIASSQSFLVRATDANATLTISDEAFVHQPSGAMYAPEKTEHFNVLGMTLTTDDMEDQLFLVESENCSPSFDNGYDGTKIKEKDRPQIFGTNRFGFTAVNADKTMLNQKIGYCAAMDGAKCTISFNTDRMEGYSELYLLDRVTKSYTNILAGENYTFTGNSEGDNERFEIVGRRDDGSKFVGSSDQMIEVIGQYALLSGFDGMNEMVYITDMNGRRLWSERSSNGPSFFLPELPAGIYMIYCGNVNCKFVVK